MGMTVKEMVTEVLDGTERFPRGWATEVRDYFRAIGRDHLECRQRWVYELEAERPGSGEDPRRTLYRSRAMARERMEAEMGRTIAAARPRLTEADILRDGDEIWVGGELHLSVRRVELIG